jgi:hypothetical protein
MDKLRYNHARLVRVFMGQFPPGMLQERTDLNLARDVLKEGTLRNRNPDYNVESAIPAFLGTLNVIILPVFVQSVQCTSRIFQFCGFLNFFRNVIDIGDSVACHSSANYIANFLENVRRLGNQRLIPRQLRLE